MRFNHLKGFTVLELLISITIIVVLFSAILMVIRPKEIFERTDIAEIGTDKIDLRTAYIKYKIDHDGEVPFDEPIFNGVIYKICLEEITDCNMDNFEVSMNKLKENRTISKIPVHPTESDGRYTGYYLLETNDDASILTLSEISYTSTNAPAGQCFTYNSLQYCVVVGEDGNLWLDRNLGATTVATVSTTTTAYGDLYQWGRSTDGHQLRNSSTSAGPNTSLIPGSNFLTRVGSPYNWYSGTQINALWQRPLYINGVCPPTWRIPNSSEWQTEILEWSAANATGAIGSTLKLPSSGRRGYNGTLTEVDTIGYYASSSHTIGTDISQVMRFTSSAATASYNLEKAQGVAVRCFKSVTDEVTQSSSVFSLNADSLGNCINPGVNGTYNDGVAMNSTHTVELDVFVTSPGTYSVTTNTVNGMSFSKTGTFASTGYSSIILTNNGGTPVSAGNFALTGTAGTSICAFNINVV